MNLKNFLEWLFRGWLPEEPKMRKSLLKERARLPIVIAISATIVIVSFSVLSSAPTQPTSIPPPPPMVTGEYNPGVSVGDYVVYGNFVCNREHPDGWLCIADLAFKKMEVVAVSEKEVTFLHTDQFKNGTAAWNDGRTETWDVEKAVWSENTADYVDSSLIIAANLTEGDCIQTDPAPSYFNVAEAGVRTYLGVSRNVSVLHMRGWVDNDGESREITYNLVYDQVSGIRLEWALMSLDGDLLASMSVVETNIFSASS